MTQLSEPTGQTSPAEAVDPPRKDTGLLTTSGNGSNDSGNNTAPRTVENAPEAMDKETIERLGRQRPEILPSWFAEVMFVFSVVMSTTIGEYFIGGFNIVLPPVAAALHIPESAQTWPAGATTLTMAALLQPFARSCDIYGGRVVFLTGHVWLLVWSLICGFSQNTTMLIVCRAMQGIGSAAFLPAGLAILSQTYRPGPRKNFIFAIFGACSCVGFYFGIFVGSVTAEYLTWRWYFWIGAAIGLLISVSGFLSMPANATEIDPSVSMDWLGALTIVPGLILVVFAFMDGGHAPDGWKTPYIYVTLILGVLLLAAAVYVQGWVSAQPLLPMKLFKVQYMKRLMVGLFCAYGVFGLFLFYASFYIENVMHIKPILTAAWFTPLAVGGMILAIAGGLILHIIPNRILLIIACLGSLISVLLFALIPDPAGSDKSTSFLYWAYIFPAMCGSTIGVDIIFNVTNVFITTAMPRKEQAAASGVIMSLLCLGIAFWLGMAELAVSVKTQIQGHDQPLEQRVQYQIGFWTGVGLAVVSLVLMATVKMGQASAAMTADEKAAFEADDMRTKEER